MTNEEKVALLFQSPKEIQLFSNISHNLWGVILIVVSILFILNFYKKDNRFFLYAPSIIFTFTGFGFLIAMFLYRGFSNIGIVSELIWVYPHIYIHVIMGIIHFSFGLFEFLTLKKFVKYKAAHFIFPYMFMFLAITLILHPHNGVHNDYEMFIHSLLGVLFFSACIFYLLVRVSTVYRSVYIWIATVCLFLSGGMLMLYKEPEFAYYYAFPKKISAPQNSLSIEGNAVIYISNSTVTPHNIKIKTGKSVEFIMVDSSFHDMASGPHPAHTNYPPLNIGFLEMGQHKLVQFNKSGVYGFHDHLNDSDEQLQGTIIVED